MSAGVVSRRTVVGWPPYEGILYGPVIIEGEAGKPPPMLETDGFGDGVLYYGKVLENTPVASHVLIEDCEISDCDGGILGGVPGQTVTLRRCYFHDNGSGNGLTHNIYVGAADELVVEDVLSTRCAIGHLLKTRAAKTTIRNSRLLGGGGTESACLDVPNAGVLQIDGLTCEKSSYSDAHWMIHYAGENQDADGLAFHNPSSVRINDMVLLAPGAAGPARTEPEVTAPGLTTGRPSSRSREGAGCGTTTACGRGETGRRSRL